MKYVSINNGYSFVKGEFGQNFKSAYRETTLGEYGCSADLIEMPNGKVYAIGDGNTVTDKDKTKNIATKLFVLNMLSKNMQSTSTEHFHVFLTAPPMTFASQKDSLPEYLKGSYRIKHNGVQKDIYIDDVTVYPETITAYLANNPSKFKRPVIIIDIGGLTTNVAYIDNGSYNKDTIISFVNGMYNVETEVCDYLNDKYWDLNLDTFNVHEFLQRGIRLGDSAENIIEKEKDGINAIYSKFVSKIANRITMKNWSPNMCDILVTGGGGKLLLSTIQKWYKHAKLSNDPIFDNLNGTKLLMSLDIAKKKDNGGA